MILFMVRIYISWCPGISSNNDAMSLIKKSGLVAGIETCSLDSEIDLIKKSKLKVNIHNPLRKFHIGLENKNFRKEMNPERLELCKKCDECFMGFHSCYDNLEKRSNLIFARLNHYLNVSFLRKNIGKRIIFESPPHRGSLKASMKVVSPEFIEKMINYSDGYLFDVAHNFITLKAFEKQGKMDYKDKIIQKTKGKVLQMHLNCPLKDKDGNFVDAHLTFTGRDYEEEVLNFAREVINANPQLQVLTLEMNTNTLPKEHAEILIRQAKYLKKKLNV